MSDDYSVPPIQEQDNNPDLQMFEDQLEEPPFVYLGLNYPAEIATELPGHVYSFEQAWKEAKTVKVYELLGKPPFRNEKDIDNESLEKELTAVIGLMEQYNIHIDIPTGEDNRAVYKYITEIVFDHEVDDLKLGGLGRHFFYREDFSS